MATKKDLINLTIQKDNIVGLLNLCINDKQMTDICKNEVKVHKKIISFFNDITDDNEDLREIAMKLIFQYELTDEKKIRSILNFLKNVLDKRNVDIKNLKQLVKLLRTIETRKKGGWIYVNYKVELDKLYNISGNDNTMQIDTNDDQLIKMLFEKYFKVKSQHDTIQIYQF
jgi:hypothetical protein